MNQDITSFINIWILFGVCFYSCSISKTDVKEIVAPKEISGEPCVIIQDSIDLGPKMFHPFDSIFNDFNSSDFEVDIIIRSIGQVSSLIRVSSETLENSTYIIDELTNKLAQRTEIQDFSIKNLTHESYYSKVFLCNTASSDMGTHIYLVKLKGVLVLKLWIENGAFKHLSNKEQEKLKEFKQIISFIRPYLSQRYSF